MNWPWVSRLAYQTVKDENDRLRAQNDKLLDHLTRIDRIEHGVSELPREKKEPPPPMPPELKDYIDQWGDRRLRQKMTRDCYRERAGGKSWDRILRDLQKEDEEQMAQVPG